MLSFKQWEKVDHSELMDDELPIDEFLDVLVEKLKKLLSHHFIYKQQDNFLKNKKETLNDNECIIILDFAENYTLIVQMPLKPFIGIKLRQQYILLLFITNRMKLWNTRPWRASVICFNMMWIQFTHFKKQSFLMLRKRVYSKQRKWYISVMAAVEIMEITKISLIFYITIATMHCMQNSISL